MPNVPEDIPQNIDNLQQENQEENLTEEESSEIKPSSRDSAVKPSSIELNSTEIQNTKKTLHEPDSSTISKVPKQDEDDYFCLNVVSSLIKRLPVLKKAQAKLHILSYLYKLEQEE